VQYSSRLGALAEASADAHIELYAHLWGHNRLMEPDVVASSQLSAYYWDHTNPPQPLTNPLLNESRLEVTKRKRLLDTRKAELPHRDSSSLSMFKSDVWGWGWLCVAPILLERPGECERRVLSRALPTTSWWPALTAWIFPHSPSSPFLRQGCPRADLGWDPEDSAFPAACAYYSRGLLATGPPWGPRATAALSSPPC